ncbi:hypothetical protein CBM2617_A90196 [Cupriavidus taiwanensis]|nr:hypothetical protein CBM2617_A90196 [Cupriavidus taiwanensis]SOZ76574.1 hypothetical protein CBM2618_A100195 [Cupriavidus taiwanensis]SPA47209.1 hypothetical protein CBM2629_A80298 [Cupriavidus taiwanensis]SPD42747.1 protein of unknown function [Cupriavidus taiwanensis]
MAGNFRFGPGAPECAAQYGPRSRALYRFRVRLRPRAPDYAALWHQRPAPVLRGRRALPAPVRLSGRCFLAALKLVTDYTEYLPDQKRHAILGILASHLRQP